MHRRGKRHKAKILIASDTLIMASDFSGIPDANIPFAFTYFAL